MFIIFLSIVSCNDHIKKPKNGNLIDSKNTRVTEFQNLLDSAKVEGAILVYDLNKDSYYSNDFEWVKRGKLPASTFKIANSIIALETGVVASDSTLFEWNGQKRRMKVWEQDLIFKQAFHLSCVPCYQEVARKIGSKRMNHYLEEFEYGRMMVDSTNIDLFWLEGDSKINQLEQIDFLKRFYQSNLPISKRTEKIMKRLMVIEETENYKISGKTGWSIRNGNNNGWFVGYIESTDNTYFFATNIEPKGEFNMDMFPLIRKEISYKAFNHLDILKMSPGL